MPAGSQKSIVSADSPNTVSDTFDGTWASTVGGRSRPPHQFICDSSEGSPRSHPAMQTP